MKFGYFTLSDNHYENNYRDANSFVANIRRHLEEDRGGRFRRGRPQFQRWPEAACRGQDLVARFTAEVARQLLTAEPRTTAELQYKAVARHSRQSRLDDYHVHIDNLRAAAVGEAVARGDITAAAEHRTQLAMPAGALCVFQGTLLLNP